MNKILLYVDIGNTAIKYAIRDKDNFFLIKKESVKKDLTKDIILDLIKLNKINLILFSSVRPSLSNKLILFCKELKIKILNIKDLNLKPFFNFLEKKSIGADLMCLVAGASSKYKNDNIIISLGTATTISVVLNNNFIGSIIIPGIDIAAKALFDSAELLSDYDYLHSKIQIKKNTKNALNLGIVNSTEIIISHWINYIQKEYSSKKFAVIFTGGYMSKILIDNLDYKKNEFLVFEGMHFFAKKNKII